MAIYHSQSEVNTAAMSELLGITRLGFYYFQKKGSAAAPITVDYMFRIHNYQIPLRRYTLYGSFTAPPVAENDGSFYFTVDITKQSSTYKISPIVPELHWKP